MRVLASLAPFLVPVLASQAQTTGAARPQFRCEVPQFTGAMSPQGAVVTMTVASDGLACSIINFGMPQERRNPATSGEISEAARHGNAVFLGAAARYVADPGYVGPDAFAYRATARDADNIERVIAVRVQVDVRPTMFDRVTTGMTNMLISASSIRAGNDVPVPRKVKDVRPAYPSGAQASHVQGIVVLDATVNAEGKVDTVRVVRSVPLLDSAATAAVQQWEYTPTVINGRAVPVIISVTVAFPSPESTTTTAEAPPKEVPRAGTVKEEGPLRPGTGISMPAPISQPRPSYTSAAMRAGIQGTVLLEVVVRPDGSVTDVRVIKSLDHEFGLDEEAIKTARQWRFRPGTRQGEPVSVYVSIELTFALRATPTVPSMPESPARPATASAPASASGPSGADADADIRDAFEQLNRRKYEDTVKALQQANERRGRNCAICYLGMARAYEALGAAKNVVENCDRALAAAGVDQKIVVQAYQLKAVALMDLAQTKDVKGLRAAEDVLRAALALDPGATYLHFNLGMALLREGRDEDGIAELKAELSLRPDGPYAPRARQLIENPRRARESFAPEFSVVTFDREFIDLAALKGKVVLLDFWGTWCAPCVSAVPTLRDLRKRHAKDAFVLLSVSSDSDEAVVRNFIDKNQMTWPQYWDRDRKVQNVFDIRAFPTYVVIDDEGIVRFRTTGGGLQEPAGLENAIKTQLKAAANRSRGVR